MYALMEKQIDSFFCRDSRSLIGRASKAFEDRQLVIIIP